MVITFIKKVSYPVLFSSLSLLILELTLLKTSLIMTGDSEVLPFIVGATKVEEIFYIHVSHVLMSKSN